MKLTEAQKCELLDLVDNMLDDAAREFKVDPTEDGPFSNGLGDQIYNLLLNRLEK
jgi:hypothetical protein